MTCNNTTLLVVATFVSTIGCILMMAANQSVGRSSNQSGGSKERGSDEALSNTPVAVYPGWPQARTLTKSNWAGHQKGKYALVVVSNTCGACVQLNKSNQLSELAGKERFRFAAVESLPDEIGQIVKFIPCYVHLHDGKVNISEPAANDARGALAWYDRAVA